MSRQSATVEQVRQAQDHFKAGVDLHKDQKYKDAIAEFKQGASINPYEEGHLKELATRLTQMSVKLVQESTAYMGCAAVHLNGLIQELSEDEKEQVPIDESLQNAFNSWEE